MTEGLRVFFASSKGKFVAVVLVLAGLVAAYFSLRSQLDPYAAYSDRTFICSETGKSFAHKLKAGESEPIMSPYSGKETGYEAELCYWTKDGKTKSDPTPVLMNRYKGVHGPTFCPDCGRLVVGHNPMPGPDSKPPPTEAEYAKGGRAPRTANTGS